MKLLTIQASHYCDKARWGLELAGVAFEERCYAPGLHRRAAGRHGGTTVPVLLTDEGPLLESRQILRFADRAQPGLLYPTDPALRDQTDALEQLFDAQLGPATRRVAYFHLLPHAKQLLPALLQDVSGGQRVAVRALWPLLRWLMKKAMRIDAAGAERSAAKIEMVFEQVAQRLADGRRFLVGERFGAADLTFAALAAPVLFPENYPGRLPALAELPEALRELVLAHRERPAGQFGLRLYREER